MKTFLRYTLIFWSTVVIIMLILVAIVRCRVDDNAYTFVWKDKVAMLDKPNRKPSIVLLGGSNVAFGFDSQLIVDSINMPVINVGYHAGMGLKCMMDECFPRLRKGDVLVFTPETASHFYGESYYGGDQFAYMFYMGMIPWHDVSAKQARRIIEQTPTLIKLRLISINLFVKSEVETYKRDGVNKYGDMVWHWSNDSLKHVNAVEPNSEDKEPFNDKAMEEVILRLNELKSRGVKVVMFSPAADKKSFENMYYRFSTVAEKLGAAGFKFPDPSGVDLMENDCTYDMKYHMCKKGAILHTQHLIAWLKQQGIGK
jgi:hypothetical protein